MDVIWSVQGQVGWCFVQPGLVERIPAYGVWTGWSFHPKSLYGSISNLVHYLILFSLLLIYTPWKPSTTFLSCIIGFFCIIFPFSFNQQKDATWIQFYLNGIWIDLLCVIISLGHVILWPEQFFNLRLNCSDDLTQNISM